MSPCLCGQKRLRYSGGGLSLITPHSTDRERALGLLRERIVGFVASRMSRDVAEDVAQDVLVVLEEKYAGVTALGELLPLVLQIARFKMAGLRRRTVRRGEYTAVPVGELQLADGAAGPEAQAERREMLERLSQALTGLGERCRELFRLKLAGMGFAEIQKELGAGTLNTVYTWDARCRRDLLERMGGRWEK